MKTAHQHALMGFIGFLGLATTVFNSNDVGQPSESSSNTSVVGKLECGTVSTAKLPVLYEGVANPLRIEVGDVTADELIVTALGSHEISLVEGKWVIVPTAGYSTTVQVVRMLGGNGDWEHLAEQKFRIKKLPDPVAEIAKAGASDGRIKKEDLLNATRLNAKLVDFDLDIKPVVQSFSMLFVLEGELIELHSKNARLTPEMTDKIELLGRGTKIYIQDILVKMPGNSARKIGGLSLRLF